MLEEKFLRVPSYQCTRFSKPQSLVCLADQSALSLDIRYKIVSGAK